MVQFGKIEEQNIKSHKEDNGVYDTSLVLLYVLSINNLSLKYITYTTLACNKVDITQKKYFTLIFNYVNNDKLYSSYESWEKVSTYKNLGVKVKVYNKE